MSDPPGVPGGTKPSPHPCHTELPEHSVMWHPVGKIEVIPIFQRQNKKHFQRSETSQKPQEETWGKSQAVTWHCRNPFLTPSALM